MMHWTLGDPFIGEQPTEEEYNRAVAKIRDFIKSHPDDRVFVKMQRRVYCPRCHKQVESEAGACICHSCKVWFMDSFRVVERDGTKKTVAELYPEWEEENRKRLPEYEYIDYAPPE